MVGKSGPAGLLRRRQFPPSRSRRRSSKACSCSTAISRRSGLGLAEGAASALPGGCDSRLILALLRRHGISPRVYVYGPPGNKDVELARAIAEGEGFALEVVDKDRQPALTPGGFGAVASQHF